MPIQNCPIYIPEGWEFVRIGIVHPGERYIRIDGQVGTATETDERHEVVRVIIRRVLPELEVGDWVRLARNGFAFSGRVGRIESVTETGKARVVFDRDSDGMYCQNNLIKQTRKIEPYTIDQCIAEIAKRGSRGVIRRGSKKDEIETIYENGVATSGAHIGFVSYGSATGVIAWPNGDAFGIVTWRDAE